MLTGLAVSAVVHAGPMVSTASIPKPDTVSPGFAGFATVFLLTCATILLIRSMVKHLRKVRYSPEPPDPLDPHRAPGAEVGDVTGNVTGHSPVSPGEDRSAAN